VQPFHYCLPLPLLSTASTVVSILHFRSSRRIEKRSLHYLARIQFLVPFWIFEATCSYQEPHLPLVHLFVHSLLHLDLRRSTWDSEHNCHTVLPSSQPTTCCHIPPPQQWPQTTPASALQQPRNHGMPPTPRQKLPRQS